MQTGCLSEDFPESRVWGGNTRWTRGKSLQCGKKIRVDENVDFATSQHLMIRHGLTKTGRMFELTVQAPEDVREAWRAPSVDALM